MRFFLSDARTVPARLKVDSQATPSSPEKKASVDSQAASSFSSASPVWEKSGPASPLRCFLAGAPRSAQMAVEKSFSTVATMLHGGAVLIRDSGVTAISL